MNDKELNKILDEAKKAKDMPLLEKMKIEQARRERELRQNVKRVVQNATAFQWHKQRDNYTILQSLMAAIGVMATFISAILSTTQQAYAFALATFMIMSKLIIDKLSTTELSPILKDKNLSKFSKLFVPATRLQKGTLWLKASEISAYLEKKGDKITAEEMGKSLRKICLKIHKKYLVKCL